MTVLTISLGLLGSAVPGDGATLSLLFRWLHVLTAVVAVGGVFFMRFILLPAAAATLSPAQIAALRERVIGRWKIVVMVAITLLLISGVYNFMVISVPKGRIAPVYHMLFGIKFLAALAVFFLASALTARSAALQIFRDNFKFWGAITAGLGLLVVMLGGVLWSLP